MAFDNATRRKIVPLAALSRPTGGGTVQISLPGTGLLARLWLIITGSVAGTLSAQNSLGFSSVVSNVHLQLSTGPDLINISGQGYHWLYSDFQGLFVNPNRIGNARSAVTATTFDISMVFDLQVNQRDPLGLIALQDDATKAILSITFLADASVAAGATVTATVTPVLELFTVPVDPKDYPPLSILHTIMEVQEPVASAGQFIHKWPRGAIYLGTYHGYGFGVSGVDNWSEVDVRSNQANYWERYSLSKQLDYIWALNHPGTTRPAGAIPLDYLGTSGLGAFGTSRDMVNSVSLTDLETVITATAGGTLYSIHRQLVQIAAPAAA